MQKHPEKSEDEFFIGNTNTEMTCYESHIKKLKELLPTLRFADNAISIDRFFLPENYKALFVKGKDYDVYNKYMDAKLRSIAGVLPACIAREVFDET